MRSKVIVREPEFQALPEAWAQAERRITSFERREIRKALINSDEHPEWQVYHAQPRFGLQRIPRTDHGQPGAAVLELAGVCIRLAGAAYSLRLSPPAPTSFDLTRSPVVRPLPRREHPRHRSSSAEVGPCVLDPEFRRCIA
jgi:hypothetical protein